MTPFWSHDTGLKLGSETVIAQPQSGEASNGLAPAAVANVRIVLVVDGLRAVVDDEAVVDRPRPAGIDGRLPKVAAERRVHVAGHVARDARHLDELLACGIGVVRAERDAGRVIVEGAEAELDARPARHGALRLAVDGRAAVVAEAVPPDVVVMSGRARRLGRERARPGKSGDDGGKQQAEQGEAAHERATVAHFLRNA
jgi:hypothetical protein